MSVALVLVIKLNGLIKPGSNDALVTNDTPDVWVHGAFRFRPVSLDVLHFKDIRKGLALLQVVVIIFEIGGRNVHNITINLFK